MKTVTRLSAADTIYAVSIAVACLVSYEVITLVLSRFVERSDQYLGGMWAAVATVFVFKDSRSDSVAAGLARLLATCVSFVLCLVYFCLFPFTPVGLAVVLGAGTVVMILLNQRDDIVTTGITTCVVMVAAAMSVRNAWHQPMLRLLDTVVGIAVGVGFDGLRRSLMARLLPGEQAPNTWFRLPP